MLTASVKCVLVGFLLAGTSSAQNTATGSNDASAEAPEQVCLSEILIRAPESDTQAQITAKGKAEQVRNAVRLGGEFADLASANSQGPSASQGGAIGSFKRGQLAKPFEEKVFRMKVGEVSDVLSTRHGFVILQVTGPEQASYLQSPQQTVQSGHASGVKGRVIDNYEHVPISNAYVLAHRNGGTDVHVRTDANGKYAIPLPLGIYDVFISADAFSPTSRKIEVTADGMMIFDAAMEFNTLGITTID